MKINYKKLKKIRRGGRGIIRKIMWFIHKNVHKLSDRTLARFDIFTNL